MINQEAIGSPSGSTKREKPTQESKHAQKESRYAPKEERLYDVVQEKPDIEEKKGSLETTCLYCGEVFTDERSTKKFCSGKCKTAYYRKKSKEEII